MSVTIAVVNSKVEAELMVGALRNAGIAAFLSADDLGGVDLALQAQGVKVLVSNSDQQAALESLSHFMPTSRRLKPPNPFQKWLIKLLGGKS